MTRPVGSSSRRRGAKAPAPRTARAELGAGEFAGWYAVVRADFPLRVLEDLQSGNVERMGRALDRITVDHNMPDTDGNVAASMADVDPYDGMLTVAAAALEAITKLPPR